MAVLNVDSDLKLNCLDQRNACCGYLEGGVLSSCWCIGVFYGYCIVILLLYSLCWNVMYCIIITIPFYSIPILFLFLLSHQMGPFEIRMVTPQILIQYTDKQ